MRDNHRKANESLRGSQHVDADCLWMREEGAIESGAHAEAIIDFPPCPIEGATGVSSALVAFTRPLC